MVSTRGVKLKFFDGERVLCYEPDPTKAKVLYDSKVLQVIANKDQRGRKTIEYLIHFQGWNSSWDRCVGEDFVLKDTPENRQLQKDLADKAQLQLFSGAYLYRRERSKKRKDRKLSERIGASSEDGSSGSPALMDTDDANTTGVTTSSESNSSGDEDIIPLELTTSLRHALENDHFLINNKHKLLKLPADPHVANILEKYWKYYSSRELSKISDKSLAKNRNSVYGGGLIKHNPEHIQRNINTCKELVDGLRVYFDYTLSDLLLYNRERDQIVTAQATELAVCPTIKLEISSPEITKTELDDVEYSHLPLFDANRLSLEERSLDEPQPSTRRLRSHRSSDSDVNGSNHQDTTCSGPKIDHAEIISPFNKILTWRLLPDHVYNQDPPPPCLVYGATHLARLLVKLPDLLYASNMADDKLKALLRHLDLFIEFLSEHKEWFGEKHYVEVFIYLQIISYLVTNINSVNFI